MNTGIYIFAQITEFLTKRVFDCIVARYSGDKYVRHFSCWNQMLCMIFGQLINRDRLRDLVLASMLSVGKHTILDSVKNVTRSNLSKANESRNCKIFEEFAYHLIEIARNKRANDNFEIKGKIYAFDSSLLNLQRKADPTEFDQACMIAIEHQNYSFSFVQNILKNKITREPKVEQPKPLPEHTNKRGKAYYAQLTIGINN
jgi:hypothetical protein